VERRRGRVRDFMKAKYLTILVGKGEASNDKL